MKKKVILGIIIALLVIAVIAEGVIIFLQYKKNEDNTNKQNNEKGAIEETIKETPTVKPIELPKPTTQKGENLTIKKEYFAPEEDELVYTYLKAIITDTNDFNYTYTYAIPQVNLDSSYVKKLNQEILNRFNKAFDEMNETQYIDMECEGLAYEYYENDDILSFVLWTATENGGAQPYEIYNISIETEKKVENSEILEQAGMSNKKFNEKLIDAIKDEPSDNYSADIKEFYEEQNKKSIEKYSNVDIDDIEIYLNENGEICAYLLLYQVAGPDQGTYLINIETGENADTFKGKSPVIFENN